MLAEGDRGKGVLVPADEGLADDLVGGNVDDGNIGNTVVGSTNLNLHVDLLAGSVGINVLGIRKGDTLALPNTTVGVAALEVLLGTLNVAVVVGNLSVPNAITASGPETIAREAGLWEFDKAVTRNGRGEACNGGSDSVGLHCGGGWVLLENRQR